MLWVSVCESLRSWEEVLSRPFIGGGACPLGIGFIQPQHSPEGAPGESFSVVWTKLPHSPHAWARVLRKTHTSHAAEAVGVNTCTVRKVLFGKLQEKRGLDREEALNLQV